MVDVSCDCDWCKSKDAREHESHLFQQLTEARRLLSDMVVIAAQDEWDKATTGRQIIMREACTFLSEDTGSPQEGK